jgi:hypothetical protein
MHWNDHNEEQIDKIRSVSHIVRICNCTGNNKIKRGKSIKTTKTLYW